MLVRADALLHDLYFRGLFTNILRFAWPVEQCKIAPNGFWQQFQVSSFRLHCLNVEETVANNVNVIKIPVNIPVTCTISAGAVYTNIS